LDDQTDILKDDFTPEASSEQPKEPTAVKSQPDAPETIVDQKAETKQEESKTEQTDNNNVDLVQ